MRADDAAAARSAAQVNAPASPLLTVRGLRKSFAGPPRVEVLADIGFSVGEGEFVSVVGPSGCGKTTLLLALSGLQPADTGEVTFAGTPVRDRTPEGMAIVFQDYSRSLLPWRTNLATCCSACTAPRASPRPRRPRRRWTCSSRSGSPDSRTIIPGSCRAECSSAWRSPAASRRDRACCCSTSRLPPSTRRRAPTCRTSCSASRAGMARPAFSSRTTWRRRSTWAIASSSSRAVRRAWLARSPSACPGRATRSRLARARASSRSATKCFR